MFGTCTIRYDYVVFETLDESVFFLLFVAILSILQENICISNRYTSLYYINIFIVAIFLTF